MDRIMSDYPGLFGLSGNVEDRRNPYGRVMTPQLAQVQAEVPMVPQYNEQLSSYGQGSIPVGREAEPGYGPVIPSVMPQNQRPLMQGFQPPPQPPPIQNMNFQGTALEKLGASWPGNPIPINLISALSGG